MPKLKSIVFVVGLMLLLLSVVMGYFSIDGLSTITPAEDYLDRGIITFSPYEVTSQQVKNTSASSRERRMYPTKTVYMVCYRATDGSGYKWTERAITPEMGQTVVDAGITVKRRVLSIPDRGTYITVEPGQTAESFTAEWRQKYIITLGLSAGYLLLYLLAWRMIWRKNKKERLA